MNSRKIIANSNIFSRQRIAAAILVLVSCLFFSPKTAAAAASLYLFPPSGTYQVGGNFTVAVRLSSGDVAVNAAEAALVFNPSELQVQEITKTGSIFNLWTTDPAFSNAAGTINLGGGNQKEITGTAGTVVKITFKAKAAASAQVNFSSGSVLAADGQGTNVLSAMNGGLYTLTPAIATPAPEKVPSETQQVIPIAGVPLAPVVSSITHPDPSKWYSNSSPEFSWELPDDITGIRMTFDEKPSSAPATNLPPETYQKKLDNLKDGAWYLHIQFQNKYGWGLILHRKFLIDTQPPTVPEIKITGQEDPANPEPSLIFSATDLLSGIHNYQIGIGDNETVNVAPSSKNGKEEYKLPSQFPGKHTIILKAIDGANNFSTATADFDIKPLESPIITDYPRDAHDGDTLIVRGTSVYPGITVFVMVKKDGYETETLKTRVGDDGKWIFVYDKTLQRGAYQIWARISDARGAQSFDSATVRVAVQPTAFVRVGTMIIDYFGAIMLLLALIAIFGVVVFLAFFAVARLRRKTRSKADEFSNSVSSSFDALREELRKQVEFLDNQPGLSDSESIIYDKLTDALAALEKFIANKIDDLKN